MMQSIQMDKKVSFEITVSKELHSVGQDYKASAFKDCMQSGFLLSSGILQMSFYMQHSITSQGQLMVQQTPTMDKPGGC